MLESIVVIVIVCAATLYVGRRLFRQMKGRGCEGCDCAARADKPSQLIQISPNKRPGSVDDAGDTR